MDARIRRSDWRTSPEWHAYAYAFDVFRQKAAIVQSLSNAEDADRAVIDNAVLAMEAAREQYRRYRDALVVSMTERRLLDRPEDPEPTKEEIRQVASLLWQLEGKPEGRALEDWYWAEDILRRATAVAV